MNPGLLLCKLGRHDWRQESRGPAGTWPSHLVDGRAFRLIGDRVPCRRGCGAVLLATRDGWQLEKPEA